MLRPAVQVENVAEIAWGALLIIYLVGAGRPEYLQWPVLTVFGLSAIAALLELYLRRIQWPWLIAYDTVVWTLLISAMVCVTGGRGSEVWPAFFMMSLTAPSVGRPLYHYSLMAFNSLLYGLIYTLINPYGVEFNLSLLFLRIGLFFLVTYVVDRSMDRERSALQTLIQVANSRVNELVSARDNERRRIASDIHDWLGTGIVAPMRKLELAVRTTDPTVGRARVEETLESLRRSHEEMRRVMENLHPHLLEQMGLTEALRAYVQQWGEESAIRTEFQGDSAPEPPPAVAVTVYRILQEALNNVAKHSLAEQVTVDLTLRRESVALAVLDDGQGYESPRLGGRGLSGMHERVAIFGGSLVIESVPGKGTAVCADIPIPQVDPNQPEEIAE
jgi:signal transduction histidine kinase